MIVGRGPRRVAAQIGRAVLVEQARQHRVGRAQVRDRVGGRPPSAAARAGRPGAYGWPSTTPGTPVFVEYPGCRRMSGRMRRSACATAIAASA